MKKPGDKPDNNWGEYFRVRRIGNSTYYVTRKEDSVAISPDFRERHLARHWIRARWRDLAFEIEFLGKK